jgi:hypothetical protein
LADKSSQIILTALSRAVAYPTGVPLHGRTGGLFASTAAGKSAAQRCKGDGYLQFVRTEKRGRSTLEICAITDKGMAYLLSQISPKQVLEDFVRVLEARQAQAGDLLNSAKQMQAALDSLRITAEKVLQQICQPAALGPAPSTNGAHPTKCDLLKFLYRWQDSGASEDFPLPDLYRHACQTEAHLTIGEFHDHLRRLHDREQLYLHPWTGPLYAIPEPHYALMVGHEIAYYASVRKG